MESILLVMVVVTLFVLLKVVAEGDYWSDIGSALPVADLDYTRLGRWAAVSLGVLAVLRLVLRLTH